MNPVDPNRANAVASSIATNLKQVKDTLGQGGAGTDQAAQMAQVLQLVNTNSDLFTGNGGAAQIANDITLLNADMRDGDAMTGGKKEIFEADMRALINDLGNSGLQVSEATGQGRYNANAINTNTGGLVTLPDGQIAGTPSTPAPEVDSASTAPASDDGKAELQANCTAGMIELSGAVRLSTEGTDWKQVAINGGNQSLDAMRSFVGSSSQMNPDQKAAANAAISKAGDAMHTLDLNSTQGNAAIDAMNEAINVIGGAGLGITSESLGRSDFLP